MTKNLTCIICPMGCQLEVSVSGENEGISVSGNACPRGEAYARKELTAPERTLTCTVAVKGGKSPLVSAKTKGEVPKEQLLSCMEVVRRTVVSAPVKAGDILVRDILRTGIDVIACEDCQKA